MRQLVAKQRDAGEMLRQFKRSKKLTVPSWWFSIAPRQTASFWREVDRRRREAGVQTWDTSGMTYIINQLRSSYERHGRHH